MLNNQTPEPMLMIEVLDMNTGLTEHIGKAENPEDALAVMNDVELQPGQMVRVVPVLYCNIRFPIPMSAREAA